ncbi:hypothetical protein [Henriciella mobilis]|uniref:Uncharacterized protein n=1 Tax=Henriciella mobilis TaxID=2305467 RepID=A0A399RDB4_9PROT|nr:hypothetical protein [Henriciella mobilis]RIJ28461.1 hypothetical protein D1223_13845 [Henriciella mobilis]
MKAGFVLDLSSYLNEIYRCTSRDDLDEVLIETFESIGATALSGYTFPFGGRHPPDSCLSFRPGQRV